MLRTIALHISTLKHIAMSVAKSSDISAITSIFMQKMMMFTVYGSQFNIQSEQ